MELLSADSEARRPTVCVASRAEICTVTLGMRSGIVKMRVDSAAICALASFWKMSFHPF